MSYCVSAHVARNMFVYFEMHSYITEQEIAQNLNCGFKSCNFLKYRCLSGKKFDKVLYFILKLSLLARTDKN